ncbi:hypothetical protein [Hornefia butyriciproducens]|uniref:hypothetical protein n=1 Tax=Hornefia butyriciproducens TaxID=2652293 RepID=UPI002A9137C1|nr:hypothetical protein [Hornefia butyriciproducens]MDY6212370.1 hypothetical protein [Hornefia butyriciproducens]
MQDIKYHPLIDCDSDGTEKVPMFFCTDEKTIRQEHKMYLEEIIPEYYRLRSVKGMSASDAEKLIIHCPCCGKAMTAIVKARDNHNLGLYNCPECNSKKGAK